MPNYTFSTRRRRWTLVQTPLVTPAPLFMPNTTIQVLPLRYRPRMAARPAIAIRTPVLITSPTGVVPVRTVQIPRVPVSTVRPIALRMIVPTKTPDTIGGPYQIHPVVMRSIPAVRRPTRIIRPFAFEPRPGIHSQSASVIVVRTGLPRHTASRPVLVHPVVNQPSVAFPHPVIVRVPIRQPRKGNPLSARSRGLGQGFDPIPRPVIVRPGKPPRLARPISIIMPTGGVRPPAPSSSRIIRAGRRLVAVNAVVRSTPFIGNAKPPGSTISRVSTTASRIVPGYRSPIRPVILTGLPTSLGSNPPRSPAVLRITPRLVRPPQSLILVSRSLFATPARHEPSFAPNVIALRRARPMLPPRAIVQAYPLPTTGLLPDLIAASIDWLRRYPNVIAAFGDSKGVIKFGSDYLGQVDYPIARFSEPEEQQYRESIDEKGRIPIVTEGAFMIEVASTVGKADCRQLADLIGTTLTDADLSWQGAALMYLRQSKRRFPVTTDTGVDSPSIFRRPVEFLYQFESYEIP